MSRLKERMIFFVAGWLAYPISIITAMYVLAFATYMGW